MKIKVLILFVFILGACGKTSNNKMSIVEYEIINNIQENVFDTIETINPIQVYGNHADTISDTIIYNCNDSFMKDTTIEDYHVYLEVMPNGKLLPGIQGIQNGDTLIYCYRDTKLILEAQYKDSTLLSKIISREAFRRDLQIPYEQFTKYRISGADVVSINGDTLNIKVTLSIPDSDIFENFNLSIDNKGSIAFNIINIEHELFEFE